MTKKQREGQGAQQIGEIMGDLLAQAQIKAALPPPKRQTKKITPAGLLLTERDQKLIEASAEIATTPPSGEDMAFTHAVLCQVGLPRAKVEGREFMRQSGAAWVNVQAGYLDEGHGPVLQPIPYGVMPRLGLAWVSTFAVRNKEREIPVGDSAAEFLRLMGMDDQGRRYTTLRRQMHALAACNLDSRGAPTTANPSNSSMPDWRMATRSRNHFGPARWFYQRAISTR
jgi:hypothetical protein